ncbi:PEP-CTERM sorting domain-containing protein [Sulfuriroseicoccus oceanibius]|uniref:PEP-CTERM sorting domain-containing protein n=1 Tax=Sulfuriroseicoccus oceanibius TaxID=2707525 RepID=A0A6B3L5A8_9BACT|nr:PEP-CTERM sorting domain-containing protein [Sulfuriroseicoccus oceanibius]QQL44878.1 PEP-CTERM sorting domain-containing protein [Sulfuriroseicoccus oceanibius]
MKVNNKLAVLAFASALSLGSAHATVTYSSTEGSVMVMSQSSDPGQLGQFDNSTQATDSGVIVTPGLLASEANSYASGSATLDSTGVTSTGFNFSGGTSGSYTQPSEVGNPSFQMLVESTFSITFNVSSSRVLELSGFVNASGPGAPDPWTWWLGVAELALKDSGGGDIFYASGSSFSESIALDAGEYTLSVTASSVIDSQVDGERTPPPGVETTTSYEVNANFAAVPEPSSAALLGLGGLAVILRRRK